MTVSTISFLPYDPEFTSAVVWNNKYMFAILYNSKYLICAKLNTEDGDPEIVCATKIKESNRYNVPNLWRKYIATYTKPLSYRYTPYCDAADRLSALESYYVRRVFNSWFSNFENSMSSDNLRTVVVVKLADNAYSIVNNGGTSVQITLSDLFTMVIEGGSLHKTRTPFDTVYSLIVTGVTLIYRDAYAPITAYDKGVAKVVGEMWEKAQKGSNASEELL